MFHRRTERRVPKVQIGVRCLVDGYVVACGEVMDLSVRGAGLWTQDAFNPGDSLELLLEVDQSLAPPFRSIARVVWSQESEARARCGVRWAFVRRSERRTLAEFIAAHCATP